MRRFYKSKNRSAGYAKTRMKLLLISERIECSPQTMTLIKNDLIHTIQKYVLIDEQQVNIRITQEPPVLYAEIPVFRKKDRRNA